MSEFKKVMEDIFGLRPQLCPKCNTPPSEVGRGDGCNDAQCPYRTTIIKSFPGETVERYRKEHNGELPSS